MRNRMSYHELRRKLKAACDRVCRRGEPLLIERRCGGDVVLLARTDYEALKETAYLLSSRENALRLLSALNGRPEDRVQFDSIASLKKAMGI